MKTIFRRLVESFVIACLIVVIGNQYRLETKLFVPVSIAMYQEVENPIRKKLHSIGIKGNDKLINAIEFASEQNNISTDLIIALTWTESNFNAKALSFGNGGKYKGLMQIPHAVFYTDANILIGTRILREKLNYANGDMTKAILMYKGYPLDSPRGYQQVQKVFVLYRKLKTVV